MLRLVKAMLTCLEVMGECCSELQLSSSNIRTFFIITATILQRFPCQFLPFNARYWCHCCLAKAFPCKIRLQDAHSVLLLYRDCISTACPFYVRLSQTKLLG